MSGKARLLQFAAAVVIALVAATLAHAQDLLIGQVSSQTSPVTGINAKGLYAGFNDGAVLEWDVTTIRSRDGKTVVTDGPFVETRETVGGLVVIEARDLNEAIRIASLHPAAHLGEQLGWAIELRPIADGCHQ